MSNPTATQLVDALNGVFGKHEKMRASHAKGISIKGYFEPSAKAANLLKGSFWQGSSHPLVGRFSVGGGNPKATDKGPTVRGLAVHIGEAWDLVALSAPVFMVATPAEFVEFLAARRPDPATGKPDPAKVKAFNESCPSAKPQIDYLAKTAVPASYAQAQYWAVNAFQITNPQGEQAYGRWSLIPKAGVVGLSAAELEGKDDHFLLPELTQRLAQGPIEFAIRLQMAQEGDDIRNPTQVWPDHNPHYVMGKIVITALDNDSDGRVYDPTRLPEGIGLSPDPILQARSEAYAVSYNRRS